ncbi:unnamed protein product [Discula destructiva]
MDMDKVVLKDGAHHVQTTLNYANWDAQNPITEVIVGGAEPPKPNPKIKHPTLVQDVTGREEAFKLERCGFEYARHESQLSGQDFYNDELVKSRYYPETRDFLLKFLCDKPGPKPSQVYVMKYRKRCGAGPGEDPMDMKFRRTGVLLDMHCDLSISAVRKEAAEYLGEEIAATLSDKPRLQCVNVWRPIQPIMRDPFAVADALSVLDSDTLRVETFMQDLNTRTDFVEIRPPQPGAPEHRWYYKYGMQPDDVLIFVNADESKKKDVPKRVPHVAFHYPGIDRNHPAPARESLEVACLVVYEED